MAALLIVLSGIALPWSDASTDQASGPGARPFVCHAISWSKPAQCDATQVIIVPMQSFSSRCCAGSWIEKVAALG
jgi:hypothetical protein